jgi:hypothetical protein
MHPQIRLLLWDMLGVAMRALFWIVAGGGALAFVTWGPLGRALRRLARARDNEVALLDQAVGALTNQGRILEQLHERLDYVERGLANPTPRRDAEPVTTPSGSSVSTPD